MAWKQILWPNLDNDPKKPLYVYVGGKMLTDWYGWCLAVIHASFGAKGGSYSAKTAWQACGTKHRDRNIPEYKWVPLWYEGGQYGHVVMGFRQGDSITIYSSPYTHKATFQRFDGKLDWALDYVGKTYAVGAFSGWSETLLDSRIIEWENDAPKKSNEEICKEVWEGKWGVGKDREKRLTEAGYDYATIQRMIDAGVGKPTSNDTKPSEPTQGDKGDDTMNEPTKPEEPAQNGSGEPTQDDSSALPTQTPPDTSSDDSQSDSQNKNEDENGAKDEFAPAIPADAQFIGGVIEEASSVFKPSDTVKLIAYLVGDALLLGAVLVPDVVNAIQAPTLSVWAEYMSRTLMEAGIFILLIFKLIKKKDK